MVPLHLSPDSFEAGRQSFDRDIFPGSTVRYHVEYALRLRAEGYSVVGIGCIMPWCPKHMLDFQLVARFPFGEDEVRFHPSSNDDKSETSLAYAMI